MRAASVGAVHSDGDCRVTVMTIITLLAARQRSLPSQSARVPNRTSLLACCAAQRPLELIKRSPHLSPHLSPTPLSQLPSTAPPLASDRSPPPPASCAQLSLPSNPLTSSPLPLPSPTPYGAASIYRPTPGPAPLATAANLLRSTQRPLKSTNSLTSSPTIFQTPVRSLHLPPHPRPRAARRRRLSPALRSAPPHRRWKGRCHVPRIRGGNQGVGGGGRGACAGDVHGAGAAA